MRNTLICTVGISQIGNLKRQPATHPARIALEKQNWKQLAQLLIDSNPSDRLVGAEISSITSIVENSHLDRLIRLIFLVSDTDDAATIGQILRYYYTHPNNPIQFETVTPSIRLDGLNDTSPERFQKVGLKNLVREISNQARTYSPEAIAINATGGYKAQISFAGTIGQALGIPVYYLFEKFSKAIELPPQPVSLDLSLWLDNYELFDAIDSESGQTIPKGELTVKHIPDTLVAAIEEDTIDEVEYVALTAMGQLFHERCRLQFAKQETTLLSLIPKDETDPEKKPVKLRDDHGTDVLKAFAKRLRHSPYVKAVVNSLPFNPTQRCAVRRVTDEGLIDFVLHWTDPGYGLCIQTTGRNHIETNTIAIHLEQQFGR